MSRLPKTLAELQTLQDYLNGKLQEALKLYDYDEAEKLIKEIKPIDAKRRKAWHKEKFGPYEQIVDNVLAMAANDEIPF